jgi:Family of unknown function (DUF6098)
MPEQSRTLRSVDELLTLLERMPDVCIRYSEGREADRGSGSIDTESGLELPGLSVNPLQPESWWSRPLRDWVARQLCQYKHLKDQNPDRYAWVARGRLVARGPDCEPLLADVEEVARLDDALLAEAHRIYQERFDAGTGPEE